MIDADVFNLGPCCACGSALATARNIIMLKSYAPIPGTGWGCLECGLPSDGALAVVCDRCHESDREIVDLCAGFISERSRAARQSMNYRGVFDHDMTKHGEE